MRFDWYQATVPDNPILIVETLKTLAGEGGEIINGKGRHNYYQSFRLNNSQGERVAEVLAGGPNGHPNVIGTGESATPVSKLLRECFPTHNVTRLDSAVDIVKEGSFDMLEGVCRELAKEKRVKGRAIVPDDIQEGRTYYLGAPTSDVRVRLYDKTAQARQKLPPSRHTEIPDHCTRLELQVRPRREYKAIAATASPEDVWGYAGWTQELAMRVLSLNVERITMYAGKETDDSRAFRFMCKQYGQMLERLYRDVGSWECVGLTIGEAVKSR